MAARSSRAIGRIITAGWSSECINGSSNLSAALHSGFADAKDHLRISVTGSTRGSGKPCLRRNIGIRIYFEHIEIAAGIRAHIDARVIPAAYAYVASNCDVLDPILESL